MLLPDNYSFSIARIDYGTVRAFAHAASIAKNGFMRIAFTLFAATLTFIVPLTVHALDNNALYQWKGKDGTPTYSPDPPPAGVDYVIVDANLEPLPIQPPKPEPTATGLPATAPAAALPAPVKKSIPQWKPIRYATDPSNKQRTQATPRTAEQTTVDENSPPVTDFSTSQVSPECLLLKRETQILESYFSEATTDAEMDQAILKLQQKSDAYRKRCS